MDGVPVDQHPLMKQLFKGVYNLRPPQPRYTQTWDVSTVLNHIIQLARISLSQTADTEVDIAQVLDKY